MNGSLVVVLSLSEGCWRCELGMWQWSVWTNGQPVDKYHWIHQDKLIPPTMHVHLFLSCKIIRHHPPHSRGDCTLNKTSVNFKSMEARSNVDLISKSITPTQFINVFAGNMNRIKQIKPEVDFLSCQY